MGGGNENISFLDRIKSFYQNPNMLRTPPPGSKPPPPPGEEIFYHETPKSSKIESVRVKKTPVKIPGIQQQRKESDRSVTWIR